MPSITTRVADAMRVGRWIIDKEKPTDSVSSSILNGSAKKRLIEILDKPELLEPQNRNQYPSVNANFWLSNTDFGRLEILANKIGASSVGEVVAYLLNDAFDSWSETGKVADAPFPTSSSPIEDVLRHALAGIGRSIRAEQSLLCHTLTKITGPLPATDLSYLPGTRRIAPFSENKVLFAEAGTGVGKTAVYLAAAHEFLARNDKATAFVAVPSFALAYQVMREWINTQSGIGRHFDTLMLMGQGEFVSETALISVLEDRIQPSLDLQSDQDQSATNQKAVPEGLTRKIFEINDNDAARLMDWINAGAPSSLGVLNGHRWSMASLLAIVPEFKYRTEIALTERLSDHDDGFVVYKAQWTTMASARLIICSHAMLANLTKLRLYAQSNLLRDESFLKESIDEWKQIPKETREEKLYEITNAVFADQSGDVGLDQLPNIDLLIVDEGHQLEDAFHASFSSDLSMRSLLNSAERLCNEFPGVFSRSSSQELRTQVDACKTMREASPDQVMPLDIADSDSILTRIEQALKLVLTTKANAGAKALSAAKATSDYKKLTKAQRTLATVAKIGSKSTVDNPSAVGAAIHWSPHKSFPRLHTGRLNCSRELHYLWTVVATRSIVISGTIYEQMPVSSCETIRRTLAVPVECLMTSEPLQAQWQIDPVTLYLVASLKTPSGRDRFCRPRSTANKGPNDPQYNALYDEWLNDICGYALDAYGSAKGGMLILGTAFSDTAAVKTRLVEKGFSGPILCQEPGVTLTGLRQLFLDHSRSGERPILLAVGAAWTGFDLYAEDVPDALTDLLIIKSPFGVIRRTISRMLRMTRKTGHYEIASQVLVLVRQAVGRLVRSPDTANNRRIHWLDAEINQTRLVGLLAPVKRFLLRYKTVQVG